MHMLTLDTSQGITSMALVVNGKLASGFLDDEPNHQASRLALQAQRFVQAHGIGWEELSMIGVVTGPGGFTSVRIGVALARGLGFAANIPVVGMSMLQMMAWYSFSYTDASSVYCILPAGRQERVAQLFVRNKEAGLMESAEMQLVQEEEIAMLMQSHPCSMPETIVRDNMIAYPVHETARFMADYLLHYGKEGLSEPVPLYARPADAIAGKPLLSA